MERFMKHTKWSVILAGIALAVLGIAFLVSPGTSLELLTLMLAWLLIIVGVVALVGCIRSPLPVMGQGDFLISIIAIIFGICVLVWPGVFVAFVYTLLGILILVSGFEDVSLAFAEKRANTTWGMGMSWGWTLAFAIITIVLGLFVIVAPFTMAWAVMVVTGISLIFDGVTDVIVGIRMPKDLV
ncbi:MAG: DUF308 domain-containing protein [Atopobiaceae bacterium]|jgi:uncharacterized membrane protein HdeD (DUF308 family)|nr:DUF308 domain-containing protein [Atopobiaceae bacterium]MCH4180974.1 DUF308 domain-containing protein [Atopobiaceae bacterium]MCH4214409.1 DUF308 domain-containing protein [Atopobiaceae bacterium]MCH4276703.1 DUF308 domain-containing protein [Atopobiaceae bacterium]MCI1226387.1 DUF308 domain-containing protein [Atopobiaceae bacterium]